MDKLLAANNQRREQARYIRQLGLSDIISHMQAADVYRAYILYENGQFQLSHPTLMRPLQSFLELSQDFAEHEGIFIGREDDLDSLFFAFVHDTRRGLAQGGLRFAPYASLADVLIDGMRLSQGMTRKNALAGLNWGGGKGIMTLPQKYSHPSQFVASPERRAYFEAYGRFVASLGGIYYTAEDVGTNTQDMAALLSQNRFTTCVPASLGGSGNPSPFTARGVLRAMQAAWQSLTGNEQLIGVKVAVQGTGNVGAALIRYLDDLGADVYIADVNQSSLEAMIHERPRLKVVSPPDQIFDIDADIFAPCAIGAQVNIDTIPRLKVKLVCGAANNILREPEADAERLRLCGIAFVPDFVCNRMGIVNCADEWQGYLPEDVRLAAERVFPDTLRVFKYARSRYSTSTQAANDLADMAASELHPLLGHRGRRLMDALLQSEWAKFQPGYSPRIQEPGLEPAFVPALDEPPLRVQWEREGQFIANSSYRLAATPMSPASSPDLASFVSALLLDIKARALDHFKQQRPMRLLGCEHGGLALQIAVEQSVPYEREDLGQSEFVSLCRDFYHRHEAEIREQLQQMGIGFEHRHWLSPMKGPTQEAIDHAFDFLKRADLLYTLDAIAFHCPRCESIRVASDVLRQHRQQSACYVLTLLSNRSESIKLEILYPEFLPTTVAVAVHPDSTSAHLSGQYVIEPLSGRRLPIVSSRFAEQEPELVSPLSLKRHEKIAQEHDLQTRIQIFDKKGLICLPGFEGMSRETAREKILQILDRQWTQIDGSWSVETPLCSRCEAHLIPRYGDQQFVKIQPAVQDLKRLVESDQVTFSDPYWKQHLLDVLQDLNLWCISRQYWWGNQMPGNPDEVLSTWFTLAIWSLHGAGWPQNPKPPMIDEVFVDSDLVVRWIIPSQLAALILTGQPVFKHIHVHGALNIMERSLKPRSDVPANASDEERFLFHTVRRPMRYRLGNVIQPTTLIRRYGADAVRLAYALSLNQRSHESMLISEDRSRLARRSLSRLVNKVTGLFQRVRYEQAGPAKALDHWLVYHLQDLDSQVKADYMSNQFNHVAESLIKQSENLIHYINTAMKKRHHETDFGAMRSVIFQALSQFQLAYGPLCPFIFKRLVYWTQQRLHPDEIEFQLSIQLCRLLNASLEEPESMEPLQGQLQIDQAELSHYFGAEWRFKQ